MELRVRSMTEQGAEAISQWHYEAPYSAYDMDGDPRGLLDGSYFALVDAQGDLVGYCCFGVEAQVPGGRQVGAYDADAVDVGMGMRPDLTGGGQGSRSLRAALAFAERRFSPVMFRVTVAAWNQRAIRLCQRAGFRPMQTFTSRNSHGEWEFVMMTRRCDAQNIGDEQTPEGRLPSR